jgi:hypothetical protein
MKKLLISTLMLLIFLTACTTDGTSLEDTAVPPTEESLQPPPTDIPPTATDEPTTEPTIEPTATPAPTDIPTATPEPTETAEPTPTEVITLPQEGESTGTTGTIPEDVVFPENSVIIFTQTGGFAGFDNTWVFYEDGRVTLNGQEKTPLGQERLNTLISSLEAQNFFETNQIAKEEFCCDFFSYTLAVRTETNQNYISFSEGDPNLPDNIWQILALMREVANEADLV